MLDERKYVPPQACYLGLGVLKVIYSADDGSAELTHVELEPGDPLICFQCRTHNLCERDLMHRAEGHARTDDDTRVLVFHDDAMRVSLLISWRQLAIRLPEQSCRACAFAFGDSLPYSS